jgi:hypothetical protein
MSAVGSCSHRTLWLAGLLIAPAAVEPPYKQARLIFVSPTR